MAYAYIYKLSNNQEYKGNGWFAEINDAFNFGIKIAQWRAKKSKLQLVEITVKNDE